MDWLLASGARLLQLIVMLLKVVPVQRFGPRWVRLSHNVLQEIVVRPHQLLSLRKEFLLSG